MATTGWSYHIRLGDLRRFMIGVAVLLVIAALLLIPDLAHAADAAGSWNGEFGPNQELAKNTNNSMQGWWRTIAGWGLYLSLLALAFSIIFAGGKLWWIPVCFFLLCLFGEKTILQVASWAGFSQLA